MNTLNISHLIEVGESVFYDNQVGFAAEIKKPVQDIIVGGAKYQLQVIITSVPENIIVIPNK